MAEALSIEAALPHRPPFLFLDEIVELEDARVLARRVVRAEEPQFEGHYPGRPLMPGVLLCEAALQAGCYLMHRVGQGVSLEGKVPVVTRMSDVRFKRMVKPGDTVEIEVLHDDSKMGVYFMKGRLRVGGKLCASLSFAITLADEAAG